MRARALFLPSALLCVAAAGLHAQSFTNAPCPEHNDESNGHNWFSGHQVRLCELRQTTLPTPGQLNVAGRNGGIEVIGEDRRDVALEARVQVQAPDNDKAQSFLHEIRIKTNGTIEAEGPQTSDSSNGNWSVNYKLRVPRHLAAHLLTQNGGISVANLEGNIEAETTNGGLSLHDLAGDVHAKTVNGGLSVTLRGAQWEGAGMVARSTNGGVSVKAPENYSAHLIADTVHGGVSIGLPTSNETKERNHIDTTLGHGGPTLHFETVNGGVSVGRE